MHSASHLPSIPGSGRGEDTCFSRVDQGPFVVIGAYIVIEEHQVVFHVSGTCASGFPPKEGGRNRGWKGGGSK